MNVPEELLPLVRFFEQNPDWYDKVCRSQSQLNDTVSYSTELWGDICTCMCERTPQHKDDPVWDEVLVNQQLLHKFSALKKLGFFNQKAP